MSIASWERRTEWPLALSAVLFLICYSWSVLDPGMTPELRRILNGIDYFTWSLFVVDYVVRVGLARPKLRYVLHHVPDLLIVVLPVLRPLRLLRLVALLRIIDRSASRSLQGRVAVYVSVSTVLVLYSAALAELSAERGAPGSNIETFGTAAWWAITTITTVGYGDHYPVTATGRLVAAALMLAGVALLGVVTASLASWLVSRVRDEPAPTNPDRDELSTLRNEIRELTLELRFQRTGSGSPGPTEE